MENSQEQTLKCDVSSYVYFFAHKTKPLVKIGKANCWLSRAPNIGGGKFIDFKKSFVKKLSSEKDALDLEFMLHTLFEEKRKPLSDRGDGYTEWFCSSVMEQVFKLVRYLQKTDGVNLTPKPTKKSGWNGELINDKASPQEIANYILRHCNVWIDNKKLFIQSEANDIGYVMHPLVEKLHQHVGAEHSILPAFATFPENPWVISGNDYSMLKLKKLFKIN